MFQQSVELKNLFVAEGVAVQITNCKYIFLQEQCNELPYNASQLLVLRKFLKIKKIMQYKIQFFLSFGTHTLSFITGSKYRMGKRCWHAQI